MTDVKAFLGELRASDPKFDEAQAVVDLVRASGDMLERMRERHDWSQAELAERLGVTTARVSQLESGTLRNAPSLKMMARVAHACGESVQLTASGESARNEQSNVYTGPSDTMPEIAQLRRDIQCLHTLIVDYFEPQSSAELLSARKAREIALSKTMKSRESALVRAEEKISELTERSAHLESVIQANRANIEMNDDDLRSALLHERIERAVIEGALEAARKDNARLHSEVAALRRGASDDDLKDEDDLARELENMLERESSQMKG